MAVRLASALIATILLAAMSTGSPACESDSGTQFPLRVESGKHYPTDKGGRPFFMHGDTAWSLIADLEEEEAYLYLDDRKARGFNTVLINLLEHRFSRNAPANAYSERPFADNGDFVVPNEAYFAHADRILQRACELGFLVLLAPAYLGYGGGGDGWYQEMAAAGAERLEAYGRFVGRRYRHFDNIMWVNGGDYNPPDKSLVSAVAEGIRETDPEALQTAHNAPETAALDYWRGEPWLSINNVYTYEPVHAAALVQHAGDMPYFLIESAYENEHGADTRRLRAQAYQAILSGAFGHLFGNNPIWHFGGPGLWPVEMSWQKALDSPGARSMQVLHEYFSSIKWWELEPDTGNDFLIGGQGNYHARTMSARTTGGSLAVVYLPNGRGITLDLAKLAGPHVSARWVDPSTGGSEAAPGSPFSADVRYFEPPKGNHADWILELHSLPVQSQ
ncbi:DUF4038 domain-containing protein [Mesorhizobium newzealandense]|uniref:DUF4038 domain-containing protein n=1 Tax=Mesorhizobium newzealandense TaxID=1300302 RepID=A0ABW4U3K4_9HYPH